MRRAVGRRRPSRRSPVRRWCRATCVHGEVAGEQWRDHEGREPGARTPPVGDAAAAGRRGDVVKLPAELVVGDDHQGRGCLGAVLDRRQQVDEMVAALVLAGATGMLVLGADRFDETDRPQCARLGRADELDLVAQVQCARCGARCIVGVVVERLMVVLEQRVRAVRVAGAHGGGGIGAGIGRISVGPARTGDISVRVRPTARIPRPIDVRRGQPVASTVYGTAEHLGSGAPDGRGVGPCPVGQRPVRAGIHPDQEGSPARAGPTRAGRAGRVSHPIGQDEFELPLR